jgi:uncharacterized protein
MEELKRAAGAFLAHRRIGVAGVSREGGHVANVVFRKLRDAGYEVFALNPNATEVEGGACYPGPGTVPGGVEAVFIATRPAAAAAVVQQCIDAGVGSVWLHRSFGTGSVAEDAVELGERSGLNVIAGACPMMFVEPVDLAHRCMRWVLGATGRLPEPRGTQASADGTRPSHQ